MAPGQVALLHLGTGQYHALNEVGTRIWELLENPATLEEICDVLTCEYDIEHEDCASEARGFLESLEKAQLIEITFG